MKEFLRKLNSDKTKINWNTNPILMKLFLSFLTIPTEKQTDFLGCHTGWTKRTGENNLDITGGIVKGVEYLDRILYGKNLDNPYNNYVNPFYIFGILTEEGRAFFLDYYKDDIMEILKTTSDKVEIARRHVTIAEANRDKTFEFWKEIRISAGVEKAK